MKIRIYMPDGSSMHTDRVEASNIDTHIRANDHLAYEASCLAEFDATDGVPQTLDGGSMRLVGEGESDGVAYAEYAS